MTIKHKSTKNITEYHFDLIPDMIDPLGPFRTHGSIDKVTITFQNGEFLNCSFPFNGTYTREQWAMLAEIEKQIQFIERQTPDVKWYEVQPK